MRNNLIFRIFAVVILLAVIAGVAMLAFYAGTTYTLAPLPANGQPQNGGTVAPYYWGPFFYNPFGFPFFGFGLLRCLFPLLVIFAVFALVRMVFWRRRMWGSPYWRGDFAQNPPPFFEEWHRKAHEPKPDQTQENRAE